MAKLDLEKLTKKELVALVKESLKAILVDEDGNATAKVTNKLAEASLEAVTEAITKGLESGKHVGVHGFGSFELRERSARNGRNPQTGEPLAIDATTGVGFKPSANLKEIARAV